MVDAILIPGFTLEIFTEFNKNSDEQSLPLSSHVWSSGLFVIVYGSGNKYFKTFPADFKELQG